MIGRHSIVTITVIRTPLSSTSVAAAAAALSGQCIVTAAHRSQYSHIHYTLPVSRSVRLLNN